MKNAFKALSLSLVWAYCAVAVFDPADLMMGAKGPIFACALALFLLSYLLFRQALPETLMARILALTLVLPAIWLAVFCLRHPEGDISPGLSLTKGLGAAMLILPIVSGGIDIKKPLFVSLGLMATAAIGLSACSMLDPLLSDRISLYLVRNRSALIGFRQFGGLDMTMIFFVTSPLFVLVVPFLVEHMLDGNAVHHKRAMAAIFLAAIVYASYLSAARAGFLMILSETVVCFWLAIWPRIRVILGTLVLALVALVWGLVAIQGTALLSPDEQSNSIKIAHFNSFMDHITGHPIVLLSGDGLGATFFSHAPEVNRDVYQSELTYLDVIRYLGLPGSLLLMLILLSPVFLGHTDRSALVGFSAYLVLAGNNPLLFNSTGMLALVFFWAQQYNNQRDMQANGKPALGAI